MNNMFNMRSGRHCHELSLKKDGDGVLGFEKHAPQQGDAADKESEPLCLCPLHFGDCEYCNNGKCTSSLI